MYIFIYCSSPLVFCRYYCLVCHLFISLFILFISLFIVYLPIHSVYLLLCSVSIIISPVVYYNREDYDKLEEQKRWLDTEVEKNVQQRKQMEELQEVSLSIYLTVKYMYLYHCISVSISRGITRGQS